MRFGPAVRILISQYGLNPASIKATGPHGTLIKSDVLAVLSSSTAGGLLKTPPPKTAVTKAAAAAPPSLSKPGSFADVVLDQLRRQMGATLQTAKFTAPHAYQTVEVDMSRVDALVKTLATKKSPPHFDNVLRMAAIVKQTAAALGRVRLVTTGQQQQQRTDLAIAFHQQDGSESLCHLARAGGMAIVDVASFLHKGSSSQQQPSSALVSFHASMAEPIVLRRFAAVVRPPQVAAVSVTQLPSAVVVCEEDGKPRVAPLYSVTLSYDCSQVDDAAAAAFLNSIATSLTLPGL